MDLNDSKWMFPKIGVPQNGWFISWKTLLKLMIWGVFPLFLETPTCWMFRMFQNVNTLNVLTSIWPVIRCDFGKLCSLWNQSLPWASRDQKILRKTWRMDDGQTGVTWDCKTAVKIGNAWRTVLLCNPWNESNIEATVKNNNRKDRRIAPTIPGWKSIPRTT